MPEAQLKKTTRTKMVRNHKRADYDREVVNQIIDATPLCHVSYIIRRPSLPDAHIPVAGGKPDLLARVLRQPLPEPNRG